MNPLRPISIIGFIMLFISILAYLLIVMPSFNAQSACSNHIYELVELFCKSHGFTHGNLITHECIDDTQHITLNFTVGCDESGLYAKMGNGEWERPMFNLFT